MVEEVSFPSLTCTRYIFSDAEQLRSNAFKRLNKSKFRDVLYQHQYRPLKERFTCKRKRTIFFVGHLFISAFKESRKKLGVACNQSLLSGSGEIPAAHPALESNRTGELHAGHNGCAELLIHACKPSAGAARYDVRYESMAKKSAEPSNFFRRVSQTE